MSDVISERRLEATALVHEAYLRLVNCVAPQGAIH